VSATVKHDETVIDALRQVNLFRGLDDRSLRPIAGQTKPYDFPAGASVIDADASGKFGRLYMVVAGEAQAKIDDVVLATYGPGDHFGELSVLDGSPRSANVVATTDLRTVGLSAWNLKALLREEPDIAIHVIESLVGMLRAANAARFD
jgi:CRP-like cAMP-binding protein